MNVVGRIDSARGSVDLLLSLSLSLSLLLRRRLVNSLLLWARYELQQERCIYLFSLKRGPNCNAR